MKKIIHLVAAIQASSHLIKSAFRGEVPDSEEESLTQRTGSLVAAHRDEEGSLCVHIDSETTAYDLKVLAQTLLGHAQWKDYVDSGVDRLTESIRDE